MNVHARFLVLNVPASGKYSCHPQYGPVFLLIPNEAAGEFDDEFEPDEYPDDPLDDDGCGIKSDTVRCFGPVS